MRLSEHIRARRGERELLLMTHIVMGHPDMKTSLELIDAMVHAGVDLIELQIPFSEALADGPVIALASQEALQRGVTVDACFDFAARVARTYPIPFVFMSYYNILCKRGVGRFVEETRGAAVAGAIVPDCPLEESGEYVAAMREASLAPIFMVSPRTPNARMRALGHAGDGLVYAVARRGVTGSNTELSAELAGYLARCRQATELPLAVGFGLKTRADVQFLIGKADIAVVGSQSLTVLKERGVSAVGEFLAHLRD
jgi:tryptophan synthase alpha chain